MKRRYLDKFRLVTNLTSHEYRELEEDFNLDLSQSFVVAVLTEEEWKKIRKEKKT